MTSKAIDPLGPQTYTAAHLNQEIVINSPTPGPVTVRLSYLEPEISTTGKAKKDDQVETKVIAPPKTKTAKPPLAAETG